MRKCLALLVMTMLAMTAATAFATMAPHEKALQFDRYTRPGESDIPARVPDTFARGGADTIDYGYFQIIGGNLYAVAGEVWTFDHGSTDPEEGWYAVDVTQNPGSYFKRITAAAWGGHTNAVPAPLLAGIASAWVGFYQDEADGECWDSGLGYGNTWCQRYTSPQLTYDGSGTVTLNLIYFNDTELDFDYSKVIIRLANGTEVSLNGNGFTDAIGVDREGPVFDPPVGQAFNASVTQGQFQGQTKFNLVFEMTSDGGWSDEDADYTTEYSAFGVDDITLTDNIVEGNQTWNFESGDHGFTAVACQGVGTFFNVASVATYIIADPCFCELTGNVMEFHDASFMHPSGQNVYAFSPPANKVGVDPSYNTIMADWDQYSEMPQANGVFYRPGWNYYPFTCTITGEVGWSGRVGQNVYNFTGDDPICVGIRNVGTSNGVPLSSELVSFVYEVISSCDQFGIPPTQCTGVQNFTPIIDNIRIRLGQPSGPVDPPTSPPISFETGMVGQDGFGQNSLILSPTDLGNFDAMYDLHRDNPTPDKLGDSLVVVGPNPTASTKWHAKMWFRVRREGSKQTTIAAYNSWKTAVADGLNIVGPTGLWTFGWMDSVQVGLTVQRHRYSSEFRENDDDFTVENTESNEIVRDQILTPGTMIEYFMTSNFDNNPTGYYYLPDTTGKFYQEVEILPSYRLDAGVDRFPCLLYIDLNTGAEPFIQNALNVVLNGAGPGDPIPNPTRWDKWDIQFAASNFNAPLARSVGGNNGCVLSQLVGYRGILLNTGSLGAGTMETSDFTMFNDWLTAVICGGNASRQGFIANGDDITFLLVGTNPGFMVNRLGATNKCNAYYEAGCGPTPPDESYCVRINNAAGSQYAPAIAYDAWGNWCVQRFSFDVVSTVSGGVGNRVYFDYDAGVPVNTNYAQVVKSQTSGDNYRTVTDGVSWHHLSERDVTDECVGDSAHIVTASYREIDSALDWIYGVSIPGLCVNPCTIVTDVDGSAVIDGGLSDRLFQNTPNPFNPRTVIKFSLAQAGPAELVIFDVNGRKVKTLVDGVQTAGSHELIWDGTDDAGNKVGSGVFWSQLTAREYTSSKKMVILK